MAVLEKIRVKLGVFITVLIAVALLSFIIDPSTLESTLQMFSSKYDVGEMNGKSVSYREFQKKTDFFNEIYQMTNGNTDAENQTEIVSNMAWEDVINSLVVMPAVEKAGLKIGSAEITELTQGSHISPVLAQNPFFVDENGNYDKTKLSQMIQASSSDQSGKLGMYCSHIEKTIVQTGLLSKYYSLLQQSQIITPLELERMLEESNTTYNVDFTMIPMTAVDSSIVVSDSEIKDYYNARKKMMKQPASKDVEYVVWEVLPSASDIEFANTEMTKIYPEFEAADNMKNFLARNSDIPFNPAYFTAQQFTSLSASIADFFESNPQVGAYMEPFQEGSDFYAVKVMDIKNMPDSVFVKHILLQGDAAQKADSLMAVAQKSNDDFVAVAAAWSADKNPNVEEAGDLGWMTQQMMLPGFEEVLNLPVGKVAQMTTQYGTHLVKVTKATEAHKKYQAAVLKKEAVAGKQTYAEYYSKANDLATASNGKYEAFDKYVKENNLAVYPAVNVLPASRTFANYERAREIVRWVNENKPGSVSPILSLDNKYYFVLAVTAAHEEGQVPMNQVAPQIRQTLAAEKQIARTAEESKAKLAGVQNLDELAEALGTSVVSRTGVAFSSTQPQQIDARLLGALAKAQKGVIAGPVEGDMGVIYFVVNDTEKGSFITESDLKLRKAQEFSYMARMIPFILSEQANIVDTRYRFY